MSVWSVLAAVLAVSPASVIVVDDGGKPVASVLVEFVDRSGARDDETTGSDGRASARADFAATRATIERRGFATVTIAIAGATNRVVMERTLATIGAVSVATGSSRNAHELPVATALLDRAAVAGAPAASSDRLLRELPGADYTRSNSAFTNYGQLRASFSGAGSDRGVVLVDGIPAQDGFGGQIDWQAYPAAEIERVELLRGAGSALYGSGAVGGVLNVVTFAPQVGAAGSDGSAGIGAGTHSEQDAEILFRTPVGRTIAASASFLDSRFAYRDLAPGYTSPIDHSAQSASGVTDVRARYSAGGMSIDASGLFASDGQDEGRRNYTFDRTMRQQTISATRALGENASAGIGFYSRDTTIYNTDDLFPTDPGSLRYIQHVPTHEDGLFATFQAAPNAFDYTVRIDERRVDGRSEQYGPTGATQALGTGTEFMAGIAGQAAYRAGRFEALVGARGDRLRYDDLSLLTVSSTATTAQTVQGHDEGAISPRAALRYDASKRLAVRVSAGDGFRGPYLNELVRGFNIGKIVEAPNPNLVPERSTSYGAGLDYLLGDGRISLDALETHVSDAIAFVTLGPTLMKRENIDRTQTDSETLAYSHPLGACARVRLSGTTQTPRVTNGPPGTAGKQLAFVPQQSADLGIDARGHGSLGYSADASYVGQTYADSLQAEPLGAALLFGATVRATTASGTSFELTGDNLTHQAYLTSVDRYGPPLAIALHVSVPFGPAAVQQLRCR
jgi:iron complex outermembrane receptor protein